MTVPLQKPLITIKDLKTQFGAQVIHKNLNLTIYEGEILGIVGGSGSGKSVLMRFMIGLDRPQGGTIVYHTDPSYPTSQIGVLFQYGALISSLTAIENIIIPMVEVARLSRDLALEIAYDKLDQVGLSSTAALKYPSQLSGGMIKRVALARALALDPAIVFLDEPTSGLDPVGAEGFDKLVRELQEELKVTMVMITHDLDTLKEVCDRVAVLVDKQVVAGTLEKVADINHPWIQQYFHGVRGERLFNKS